MLRLPIHSAASFFIIVNENNFVAFHSRLLEGENEVVVVEFLENGN